MNIEHYLIDKISKRISELYKDEPTLYNAQFKGIPMLSNNVVNKLKEGEIYQNNATYLTTKNLITIAEIFDISRGELIFGDDKEVEEFVYKLFIKVAYNLKINKEIFNTFPFNDVNKEEFNWYKDINFDEKIADISANFHEISFFSARLAYLWSLAEMEDPSSETHNPRFDFDPSNFQQFDLVVDFLWEKNHGRILHSFKNDLVKQNDLEFKGIENRVISWLKYEFIEILKAFKEVELNEDNIFNIGYQVRKLLIQTKKEISRKIEQLEKKGKIPEEYYDTEESYEMHTIQDYSFMPQPDFDTPQIKPYDTDLDEMSILLDLEKIYINHAIFLLKYQDAHIRMEGNEEIEFLASPRVIRGK